MAKFKPLGLALGRSFLKGFDLILKPYDGSAVWIETHGLREQALSGSSRTMCCCSIRWRPARQVYEELFASLVFLSPQCPGGLIRTFGDIDLVSRSRAGLAGLAAGN